MTESVVVEVAKTEDDVLREGLAGWVSRQFAWSEKHGSRGFRLYLHRLDQRRNIVANLEAIRVSFAESDPKFVADAARRLVRVAGRDLVATSATRGRYRVYAWHDGRRFWHQRTLRVRLNAGSGLD